MNGFATRDNVEQIWSEGISHGEMVRYNPDQTMTIDPCRPLEYLFQGNDPAVHVDDYIKIPYRLGVITAKGESSKRTLPLIQPAPAWSPRARPPGNASRKGGKL